MCSSGVIFYYSYGGEFEFLEPYVLIYKVYTLCNIFVGKNETVTYIPSLHTTLSGNNTLEKFTSFGLTI